MKEKTAFVLRGMSQIHLTPTIFADECRRSDRDSFRADLKRIGRDWWIAVKNEESRQAKARIVTKPQ